MRRGFRQHAQRGQAQQHSRQAAPHEQHLPARQPERAGHRQQPPCHRPRDDERDGLRQHQQADDACAMAHRKPLGQEVEDAGVQAGFGRTEQKAQHVEADGPAHERHGHGDHAPGEQDAREPAARAKAFQRQVARHFTQEIADKEQPCAQPVGRIADTDRRIHVQLRKSDHRAVDIRHHVDEREKRHQLAREHADDALLLRGVGQGGVGGAGRSRRADGLSGRHVCPRLSGSGAARPRPGSRPGNRGRSLRRPAARG